MDRKEKEAMVKMLQSTFAGAGSVVMSEYSGMTVAQMTDLRAQLRAVGAKVKVVQNRLATIALKGTPAEGAAAMLKGPVAIAFAPDISSAPKVAVKFAETNDKFNIIGGFMGEEIFDAQGIETLSKLPSREELIGMAASRLIGQASQVSQRLNSVGSALVGAIKVIEERAAA